MFVRIAQWLTVVKKPPYPSDWDFYAKYKIPFPSQKENRVRTSKEDVSLQKKT